MIKRVNIPPCWEHEDGATYYVEGHVSPEAAVLSAVMMTMTLVGADEAMQLLVGGPTTGVNEDGWLLSDQIGLANDAVNSTRHIWMKFGDDDEQMYLCDAGDEGAVPWTVLSLA